MSRFTILGIHGNDVTTVTKLDPVKHEVLPADVARVRMYLGPKEDIEVDEDFDLPTIPDFVPHTTEIYAWLLKKTINDRMAVLEATPINKQL